MVPAARAEQVQGPTEKSSLLKASAKFAVNRKVYRKNKRVKFYFECCSNEVP